MDTLEVIRTRRSYRRYKPDSIDEQTLTTLLEAARWAPSWMNRQPTRLVIVRDVKLKNDIADVMIAPNNAAAIRTAPVVIVACGELGKSGYNREGTQPGTDKGDWYMFDVALALENLVLAARALGLGSLHLGLFDAKKVAALVGVPEGYAVVEICLIGYPDGDARETSRKPLNEIAFDHRFGTGYGAR